MKSKLKPLPNSASAVSSSANGNKPQVSKQVYQVAKTLSSSAPNSAGNPLATELLNNQNVLDSRTGTSGGNGGFDNSGVHFARLPPMTANSNTSMMSSSSSSYPSTPAGNLAFGLDSSSHPHMSNSELDRLREKQLEAEIMGESTRAGTANAGGPLSSTIGGNNNNKSPTQHGKSQAIEKNLSQMIKVLNTRLQALDQAAKTRLHLLSEDLNPLSMKMSDQAPKIVDEFDDSIPKSLRDTKMPGGTTNVAAGGATLPTTTGGGVATTMMGGGGGIGHSKDNLVSSDVVFIDAYHLVVKTKSQTEASKKLESALEDTFGNATLREMKNKKNKNLNQSEKSKRTEQLKNEAKRMNRMRIEKKLQLNMENFVTRSVMDNEYTFQIPETMKDEIIYPVTVKWSLRDPRSTRIENPDGEFDPDLLLRYAIERINLPSGRKLFSWLVKQTMIQSYFVALFWLLKVKFFDIPDDPEIEDREIYLLKVLAMEYRLIVELLASRSHAEHEKDFVYKYLPFILTNAVFYGFYYIFPGSRHLYTKGFKKTIYMQIIKVMHGFQICPISVKVSWAKLFPEDVHDGGAGGAGDAGGVGGGGNDEGEDGGEVFPVKLAVKTSPLQRYRASRLNSPQTGTRNTNNIKKDKSKNGKTRTSGTDNTSNSTAEDIDNLSHNTNSENNSHNVPSISLPGNQKGGMLSLDVDSGNHNSSNNNLKLPPTTLQSLSRNSEKNLSNPVSLNAAEGGIAAIATTTNKKKKSGSGFSVDGMSHTSSTNTGSHRNSLLSASINPMTMSNHNILQQAPGLAIPLSKTYLAPAIEKPGNIRSLIKRQNNLEKLNAQEISPQMTLFLTTMSSTSIDKEGKDIEIDASNSKQTFKRTIPVNWCASGGSDTHQKRSVATDLHNDISLKLKQSQSEYLQQTYHFHHEKIKAVQENQKTLDRVSYFRLCLLLFIQF
jgi:hypothetical protein